MDSRKGFLISLLNLMTKIKLGFEILSFQENGGTKRHRFISCKSSVPFLNQSEMET